VVGRRAPVISGDQNGKGREGKGPSSTGGEDEVHEMGGGSSERPGHVLRTTAVHRLLR
jgi:hypothetical protein